MSLDLSTTTSPGDAVNEKGIKPLGPDELDVERRSSVAENLLKLGLLPQTSRASIDLGPVGDSEQTGNLIGCQDDGLCSIPESIGGPHLDR